MRLRRVEEASRTISRAADIRFNAVSEQEEIKRAGQWVALREPDRVLLCLQAGADLSVREAALVVGVACRRNSVNPITDYLDGLPRWDMVRRCRDLIPLYFAGLGGNGGEQAACGEAWMVSAVARAYEHGSDVPCVPLSIGHSPLDGLRALAGKATVAGAQVRGAWLAALSMRGGDKDAYVWDSVDVLRGGTGVRLRSWVPWMWATRRPRTLSARWTIYTAWGRPDVATIKRDRAQLWAEAKHMHSEGFAPRDTPTIRNWWLDEWVPVLMDLTVRRWDAGQGVSTNDCYRVLAVPRNARNSRRIGAIMRHVAAGRRFNRAGVGGSKWLAPRGYRPS